MPRPRSIVTALAALGSAALVVTLGAAPLITSAADHLDAPSLGSIHVDASDNLSVTKNNGPLDIADVYVFRGADPSHTVLVMTVNPAVNLGIGPSTFQAGGRYTFHVDLNGDAVTDISYTAKFNKADASGNQRYSVTRSTSGQDEDEQDVASGVTGQVVAGRTMTFAGVRSDPFFFDLLGFLGTVKHQGTRRLDDGRQTDFFRNLNDLAIVLEIPNADLGGDGRTIGVWATTTGGPGNRGPQADQMGRPAINTVFNATVADKEAFNTTAPSQQRTAMGGEFHNNVVGTLKAFSSLDAEGAYTDAQAGALADILLPDVLTYQVGSLAAGPLNGRGLADDVIDAELNIVTGGIAFPGRDGTGAIPTDGIGPHGDYMATFPYLGLAH